MVYEYDVFVSYTRKGLFGKWVHDIFYPVFEDFLENTLNREVNIFIDKTNIHAGDAWPERIKYSLAHSRCLIAIWLPSYFHSNWCKCELEVMRHREKKLGYRTNSNPNGLIMPLNIFDGEHFPKFAKDINYLNCIEYCYDGDFKKTIGYIEFQKILKPWVVDLAESINKAPEWSEEWLKKEWIDDPINTIQQNPDYSFKQPIL